MNETDGLFGEGYFERGEGSNYFDYRWKPQLVSGRLWAVFEELSIQKGDHVLDYGCAKGFYVRALRQLGYDAIGIDVSEYAVSRSDPAARPYLLRGDSKLLAQFRDHHFALTLAKDVLEHIPSADLVAAVTELLRVSNVLVVSVPLCDADRCFMDPSDDRDTTHVNRMTRIEWLSLLPNAVDRPRLAAAFKGPERAHNTLCAVVRSGG